MVDPPPFDSIALTSPFPGLPDYAPTAFNPEVLIQPLDDRVSYLDGDSVSGAVYVKKTGHGWQLDEVEIRLRLSDEVVAASPRTLFASPWHQVWSASETDSAHTDTAAARLSLSFRHGQDRAVAGDNEKAKDREDGAGGQDGIPFSVGLAESEPRNRLLPGCIHLLEAGLGEVIWRLEVRTYGRQRPSTGGSSLGRAQHFESFDIHLTPCRPSDGRLHTKSPEGGPSDAAVTGPQYNANTSFGITSNDLTAPAASACRMVLSTTEIDNTESLAVGVEISSNPTVTTELATKWLRGIRSVRVQWWRRVKVTLPDTQGKSSTGINAESSNFVKESLTLLHKSGKHCRYSNNADRPVRLIFELPPLRNTLYKHHSIASIGGVGCGDVSQETLSYRTEFFLRIIIESRGGGASTPSLQASSSGTTYPVVHFLEGEPVVIEKTIRVRPPTWNRLMPHIVASVGTYSQADGIAIARAMEADEDVQGPSDGIMDEEGRNRAYRLKGSDIVGDTGTYRAESANASGSGRPPDFDHVTVREMHLNTNVQPADPPPFSEVTGDGLEALPTFDESELLRHSRNKPITHPSGEAVHSTIAAQSEPMDSCRISRPPERNGELARWREYDGYETFSAPPPAASASIGLSGSMDPPSPYDAEAEINHDHMALGNVNQRAILMEQLGLGEGTRVVDTDEDLPPGFDEPSLPSLPNAVLPHHRRGIIQRTAAQAVTDQLGNIGLHDELQPPPAFSPEIRVQPTNPGSQQEEPPPSFQASEAAEARGMPATGPEPILTDPEESTEPGSSLDLPYSVTGGIIPAPPVYTIEHQEAPPGYSRAT